MPRPRGPRRASTPEPGARSSLPWGAAYPGFMTGERRFGLDRGKLVLSEDFDAPLPDELLDLFEGRQTDPLRELERWVAEARGAGVAHPASAAFVTVGAGGQPSARTVTVKRIEDDHLVLTSALWTRKAQEIAANPRVALLLHWPSLGRQVHVSATAEVGPRALAEELFAERDPLHRWQAVVSRQGETIGAVEPLRDQLAALTAAADGPPACPPDWGALLLTPSAVEFWEESPDRLHERRLFSRTADGAWTVSLLAP